MAQNVPRAATLALFSRFVLNDLRLIRRDRFLVMMAGLGFFIAVLMRFVLPWADTYLAEAGLLPGDAVKNRLSYYFPLLVSFIGLLQSCLLSGAIFGFVFLDDKDGHTLQAIRVTPVPFTMFLAVRLFVPMVIACLLSVVMILIMGQALIGFWQLALIAAGASLFAPVVVLFYAIAAENKVQGFAMAKFVAISGWIILGGWFVPEPYQWLSAVFPPFLAHKAYWLAEAGNGAWGPVLLSGVVYQLVVIVLMEKVLRFRLAK